MSNLPTDRKILKCIYEMYKAQYPGVPPGAVRGVNDPHIAVDVRAVAERLAWISTHHYPANAAR
jgi:hypothetical protein